jgi:microcystin degradation protein MlrC
MEDFERTHLLAGEALREVTSPLRHEVEGMFRNVELSSFVKGAKQEGGSSVELVPLLSAWAAPSGPLSAECFAELCARLQREIEGAGRLDGLYVCLHGAMNAVNDADAEGTFLTIAREALGEDGILAASFDLHGNLTPKKVDGIDIGLAYKTNPHRDHARIGAQAARLLVRAVRGEIKPTTAWRTLPMILGGGITIDFAPPMRDIFGRVREMEKDARVLAASVFMCHPWNDHPELGWSTLVVTDDNVSLAEKLADELAERCWRVKDKLPPPFSSASEAIAAAHKARLRRRLGVVTISDASDVVTAGSTGENTRLLAKLITEGQGLLTYVPVRDPIVIHELWTQRLGAKVKVALGGKLDAARNTPLELEGTVGIKRQVPGLDRVVVLDVGTIRVMLVEGPAIAMRPSFFSSIGLEPWKADVIVVKNFFPFRLFFLLLSRMTIYVTTEGITDFDAALSLPFAGPVHPKDHVTDWREADARRRGADGGLRRAA